MLHIPVYDELARPFGQGSLELNSKGVSPECKCPGQLNFAVVREGHKFFNDTTHKGTVIQKNGDHTRWGIAASSGKHCLSAHAHSVLAGVLEIE